MTSSKSKFDGVKAPLHMTAHLMPGFVVQEHEDLLAEKSKELAALLVTGEDRTEEEKKALGDWLLRSPPFSKYLDASSVLQHFMDKCWFDIDQNYQMVLSPRGIGYFYPELYATLVKS